MNGYNLDPATGNRFPYEYVRQLNKNESEAANREAQLRARRKKVWKEELARLQTTKDANK